ncbi:phosphotransferase family protein [Spirillospora sp. CA-255316]
MSDPAGTAAVESAERLLSRLNTIGVLPAVPVSLEPLGGGVSNEVVAVTGPGIDVVIKHALPKLRVATEWLASQTRVLAEARALQLAAQILPEHVPGVLAVDEHAFIVVIERAPRSYVEWRQELLAGRIDSPVAGCLGRALAAWHRATAGDTTLTSEFADSSAFGQLRVDPFYSTAAAANPAVATQIDAIVERMLATRQCLVHGDFSPKNVLHDSARHGVPRVWVIDWEVAHLGDPVFDLAFMIGHLVCKSLHRPQDAPALRATAEAFLAAYLADIGGTFTAAGRAADHEDVDHRYLVQQIACLVLARIDGKSPATYLDEPARERGRALATSLLRSSRPAWAHLWGAGTTSRMVPH